MVPTTLYPPREALLILECQTFPYRDIPLFFFLSPSHTHSPLYLAVGMIRMFSGMWGFVKVELPVFGRLSSVTWQYGTSNLTVECILGERHHLCLGGLRISSPGGPFFSHPEGGWGITLPLRVRIYMRGNGKVNVEFQNGFS
jgi:hypothetical protein